MKSGWFFWELTLDMVLKTIRTWHFKMSKEWLNWMAKNSKLQWQVTSPSSPFPWWPIFRRSIYLHYWWYDTIWFVYRWRNSNRTENVRNSQIRKLLCWIADLIPVESPLEIIFQCIGWARDANVRLRQNVHAFQSSSGIPSSAPVSATVQCLAATLGWSTSTSIIWFSSLSYWISRLTQRNSTN